MSILYTILLLISINQICNTISSNTSNPFSEYIDAIKDKNPIVEAKKRIGDMPESLQPYYICEDPSSNNFLTPSAWHYSCKQSCTDDMTKHHVDITRVTWRYMGHDISTYKVTTNLVCYTSHENIWGSCSQSQTITPTKTTDDDISNIPRDLFDDMRGVRGVHTIVNSSPAPCEYFADNTECGRDYVITHRPGKLSKKSNDDPTVLNIYGDGIRVDPLKKKLVLGDAMWVWEYESEKQNEECGWYISDETTCKYTSSSDVLYCPDIGYQYIVKNLTASKTCKGDIYDKDGPAPFLYRNRRELPSTDQVTGEAMKGKSDPDINFIKGINSALASIEESYCSSSCDLFSRGGQDELDVVLDTPIGNWRMGHHPQINTSILLPCSPTDTWRIKSPTSMCHGKNHILVEDSKTKHTCSWDTEKEYITVEEMCTGTDKENEEDIGSLRKDISSNLPIVLNFWTGDKMIMAPPYTYVTWERSNITYSPNPSWFSKVKLDKGMLHNREDISHLMTVMATNMKTEVAYNKTNKRTMRSLLIDEITEGAGSIFGGLKTLIFSIVASLPKFILLVVLFIGSLWVIKVAISVYLERRLIRSTKNITFNPLSSVQETLLEKGTTNNKIRPRSRARMISHEFNNLNL